MNVCSTFARHIFLAALFFLASVWGEVEDKHPTPDATIEIPMRDGVTLPTDIYLPTGISMEEAKNLPCILVRTPSGKHTFSSEYAHMKEEGYVVAIQDARSFCDPKGKTFPYFSDGWWELQDGYDTVEWLAASPWSNGKIGTMGFSAMGISQLFMAPSRPPSLVTQYIGFAAANLYHHSIYHGSQLRKRQVEGWLGKYANHPDIIAVAFQHDEKSSFWKRFNTIAVSDKVNVPAFLYTGWYDTFAQGTIDAYIARQERGDENARWRQKLVIGPWEHHWPKMRGLGEFPVPHNGMMPPIDVTPQRWFAHYLKGEEGKELDLPNVLYYVMGPLDGTPSKGNVWKEADHWPIPSTPFSLYLTGTKQLGDVQPIQDTTISYLYDPKDPVPTIGGRNLFLPAGPRDQRPIEGREDVIVFLSEPLKGDMEVTGPITAFIWFSSNAEDTDVAVRLTDVYPDGKSVLVSDGIRRLISVKKEHLHKPLEVEVELHHISQVFAKGHRIGLSVSSSNYPRFEKNLNTLKKDGATTANNTIHTGGKYLSRLILPIVQEGSE